MASNRRQKVPVQAEEPELATSGLSDTDEVMGDLLWLQSGEEDEAPRRRFAGWWMRQPVVPIALLAALAIVVALLLSQRRPETTPPVAANERVDPAVPEAAPVAGGPTIQLASFSREDRARPYWQRVAGRDRQLAQLDYQVVQASVGDRTVYRLRASGPGSHETCDRLQSTGVPCLRIGH